MNQHRIEFLVRIPGGEPETVKLTVESAGSAERVATVAKRLRSLIELVCPLEDLEHVRDYPVAPVPAQGDE